MHSTSASKIIASAKNVGLSFKTQTYKTQTLRDVFVHTIQNPIDMLFRERDRHVVLNDVSFDVYQGDRIGLIGVNGVGKTSLCRCFAGVYKPTKGKTEVHGKVRAVFDTSVGIYPELTGRENAYLLSKFIYPEDSLEERKRAIDDALEFSELGAFLDVPFRTYSNGMQARLCLSVVSCKPCDLLILDEVFDGADQFFREKISKRVADIIKKSGAAIFVSHSQEQVLQVCNRAVVIDKTKVVFDGKPAEAMKYYSQKLSPD